ncbi:MAG: hypothetical protein ACKVP7_11105 [Hyphomicrobiaceae bacterium]
MAYLSRPSIHCLARIGLGGLLLAITGVLSAPNAAGSALRSKDCFWQLEHGRGAEIDCVFPTRLTEQEQGDLRRLTRDMLQDATCVVAIRIARALIADAIAADALVFETPPQPVTCEIVTRDGRVPITGTFAPRIVIKDGVAVDATPGLANVAGVPSYVAWPVVQYVNRSGAIRDNVLSIVNAYRSHLAVRR